VFLGLTIELGIAILGNIVRTYLSPSGLPAVLATAIHVPALVLAAFAFSVSLTITVAVSSTESGWSTWVLLLLFLALSACGAVQQFLATSVKQAQIFERRNAKYRFENGRPLLGSGSLALGPIVETWLSLGAFALSLGLAAVLGAACTSPTAAAATMVLLCQVRQPIESGRCAPAHPVLRKPPLSAISPVARARKDR
jgi:hypothetical protein